MKSTVTDPKKYAAGWVIFVLAVAVGVYSYFREHREGLMLAPLVALFGWDFARRAKVKKEELPDLKGLRWYHVLVVTTVITVGVLLLYRSVG